jgi:hypothetical protein
MLVRPFRQPLLPSGLGRAYRIGSKEEKASTEVLGGGSIPEYANALVRESVR